MLGSNQILANAYAAPAHPPPTREYIAKARAHREDAGTSGNNGSSSNNGLMFPADGSLNREAADTSFLHMVREYTVWPAKNVFCCWGYFMTGPEEDVGPNTCAWLTVITPMALFFYTWGDALAETSVPLLWVISACFASTILWFLVTSFTDPGILPRNPDPLAHTQPAPPLYRHRTDEDGVVRTDTWCTTCFIYRPPRASHCPDCDNCVRSFDHHCPFTRNCIGARNYPFFLLFLISISLSLGALLLSCLMLSGGMDENVVRRRLPQPELGGLINLALIVFAVALSLMMWGFTGENCRQKAAAACARPQRDIGKRARPPPRSPPMSLSCPSSLSSLRSSCLCFRSTCGATWQATTFPSSARASLPKSISRAGSTAPGASRSATAWAAARLRRANCSRGALCRCRIRSSGRRAAEAASRRRRP